MSPKPILAMAWLLSREYVPRVGPWLLGLYVVFLGITFNLPVPDGEEAAKLARGFTYEVATFLTLAISVFAVAIAAPRDVARKRVQSLFAKPISRTGYVLGRALGGWALCALTLLALYLITVVGFRLAFSSEHLAVDDFAVPDRVVQKRKGGGLALIAGGFTGASRAVRYPTTGPVWLTGRDDVRFEFACDPDELHWPLTLDLTPRAFASGVRSGRAQISVFQLRSAHDVVPLHGEVHDLRDLRRMQIVVESDALRREDAAGPLRLDVIVRPDPSDPVAIGFDLTPDRSGRAAAGLGFLKPEGSFELNLLRSYLLILLADVILVSFAVFASTRLSAWVSLFVAFAAYLLGMIHPFVQEVATELLEPVAVETAAADDDDHHDEKGHEGEEGGEPADDGHGHSADDGHGHEKEEFELGAFDRFRGRILSALAYLWPDLTRYDAPWLRRGIHVPWGVVGRGLLPAALYSLLFLALGSLLLWRRELG